MFADARKRPIPRRFRVSDHHGLLAADGCVDAKDVTGHPDAGLCGTRKSIAVATCMRFLLLYARQNQSGCTLRDDQRRRQGIAGCDGGHHGAICNS